MNVTCLRGPADNPSPLVQTRSQLGPRGSHLPSNPCKLTVLYKLLKSPTELSSFIWLNRLKAETSKTCCTTRYRTPFNQTCNEPTLLTKIGAELSPVEPTKTEIIVKSWEDNLTKCSQFELAGVHVQRQRLRQRSCCAPLHQVRSWSTWCFASFLQGCGRQHYWHVPENWRPERELMNHKTGVFFPQCRDSCEKKLGVNLVTWEPSLHKWKPIAHFRLFPVRCASSVVLNHVVLIFKCS